jgi:VanZ family protein
MTNLARTDSRFPAWVRWLVCAVYAAAWTAALLYHSPVPDEVRPEDPWVYFLLAKTLHVVAYAFWAVLCGWIGADGRWRWLLLALLCAHGFLSEYLQGFVPTRTPSLRDVALDLIGIALGVTLSWGWWRRA